MEGDHSRDFLELVAVLRARPMQHSPPLGCLSILVWGLGLEDVDLWRGSARPAPDGWDQPCKMEKFCASQSSDVYSEKQHTSERIICPAFSHPYSKPFLHGGALRGTAALKDELESWHMATEVSAHWCLLHGGLKCRKRMPAEQKREDIFSALTIFYLQHLKQLCLVPVLLRVIRLFCLNMWLVAIF